MGAIRGFNYGIQSNAAGPAQGFSFNVNNAQTVLTPTATSGPVIAIQGVNASGNAATIAADANTVIWFELVVSVNTTAY
jgi:hypothetical protein